ncbi:MAG: IS21 family transposase [Desulfobacula sp.]|uniref:IS21 family transposase n=1 Tax=Desulfobacula sp. TaxID=2593537 RepID=UPI002A07C27A|nr:IS21 family transposase [Candidatus Scalindua sp.]MBT4091315.1 IS21 family transposase [Deltaproteobacteria bacterium]MBT6751827.1 IS21 family transposase [Desulfobacula sp.]
MPQKRIKMKKIREIIRLAETSSLSQRQIAKAVNVSRPVVSEALQKFKATGLKREEIKGISDTLLNDLLTEQKKSESKSDELKKNFPEYAIELKRKGVTLSLLWEEYLQNIPDGLKYAQFCWHYQQWRKDKKLSMHIDHKAGDKMFVDYAGHRMEITDPKTGKMIPAEVFVAILPASQLTFAEASENQTQESFMRSNERALRFFGGVPAAIVPDNLKSGVIKADIYEPDLNPLFADFAEYYRTAVIPARSRKPKDKAHVENAVKIIYRRIFAPLRNKTFHSLSELNQAIKERLEMHNNKKLTKMEVSRQELFEDVERSELKALPINPYPLKYFQEDTLVEFNYHVRLKEDQHYYSVPHILRKKRVKLIYDDRNVAIYHDNIRIVQHRRNRSSHKYSTLRDHMPTNHRYKDNWNPEKLKWWAGNIGEETQRAVTHLLNTKPHPEQAYKSCMGILGQASKYGHDILNLACRRALNLEMVSYKVISNEAKAIMEQYEKEMDNKQFSLLPEIHKNIRGKQYYK